MGYDGRQRHQDRLYIPPKTYPGLGGGDGASESSEGEGESERASEGAGEGADEGDEDSVCESDPESMVSVSYWGKGKRTCAPTDEGF